MTKHTDDFLSHPPMRPLPRPSSRPLQHRRAFFVDARHGNAVNIGSENEPWRTIGEALHHIAPGDTLYLRDGVYYENVHLRRVGQADAPITLRSYPGELAIIDGGLREFFESPATAWEPVPGAVPDYYRSTHAYPNERAMLGWFADSMVPMLTYQQRVDIEETARIYFEQKKGEPFPLPVYFGPGIWYDESSGHVFARLSNTDYGFDYPGTADYRGATDPRQMPLAISPFSAVPLQLDGAQHVVLQDLVVRGGGENTVMLHDCQYITFDNVIVYCGTYGLRSQSSGPVKFLHSALRGGIPPWFVHSAGSLRNIPGPRSLHDPEAGRCTTGRDITRLNTHVIAALEGRTEDMINYAFPGNHHWEFAYSDFTDGFDGIHLGGECILFHHNRIDRFFDDSVYLTPLTPRYLDEVHIYQNLFTRCLLPLGFGGISSPGNAPIYIYRNVFDMRTRLPASHGKWFTNILLVGHFRCRAEFLFGKLYIYQNTILSRLSPRLGQGLAQDVRRSYALATLGFTTNDWPRRVFNNLFVHLEGMIPPAPQSLPSPDEDVQIDGNMHFDIEKLDASAAKLETYKQSEFFEQTRRQYAPGWEAQSRVGDPEFVQFQENPWMTNDYRIQEGSAASGAGVPLPEEWPDPLRSPHNSAPDAGALPLGAEPLRVGRELRPGDWEIYSWLERVEVSP